MVGNNAQSPCIRQTQLWQAITSHAGQSRSLGLSPCQCLAAVLEKQPDSSSIELFYTVVVDEPQRDCSTVMDVSNSHCRPDIDDKRPALEDA